MGLYASPAWWTTASAMGCGDGRDPGESAWDCSLAEGPMSWAGRICEGLGQARRKLVKARERARL